MEQESKIGKFARGVENALHRQAIDSAIFWGMPGWAQREAKALGLSGELQIEAARGALFSAAERQEIIYGNYERAHQLRRKALGLDKPHPTFDKNKGL